MKQIVTIKFTKEVNDRVYSFDIPMGAPLGEAYDMCHEVLLNLSKMAQDAADKAKQTQPVSSPSASSGFSAAETELM